MEILYYNVYYTLVHPWVYSSITAVMLVLLIAGGFESWRIGENYRQLKKRLKWFAEKGVIVSAILFTLSFPILVNLYPDPHIRAAYERVCDLCAQDLSREFQDKYPICRMCRSKEFSEEDLQIVVLEARKTCKKASAPAEGWGARLCPHVKAAE